MPSSQRPHQVWSLLTLQGTRSLLTGLRYRILVGLIGSAYALSAMIFGGMLYISLHPLPLAGFFYIYPTGPGPSWNYPAIWAGGPYFQLDLPILSTILMILSAAGVGLGMALAVLLTVRLIRQRKAELRWPSAVGSSIGLTPAMIALLTLGACCSTTAAATAGISLTAQSSGTSSAELLANAWYLGLFQVVVVYAALLAQEQLLRIYGPLLGWGTPDPPRPPARSTTDRPLGWGGAGSGVLRVALAVAGLTWSLSMFAGWIATPPLRAQPAVWFGWIFQHQVPGMLAILVALFPAGVLAGWTRFSRGGWGLALRGSLTASGLALLTWMPVPVSRAGAAALGNELLGYWRFPASWGAVAPPALGPVGLSLRWAFQFALLGVVAVSMGISPEASLRPFLRSSAVAPGAPADGTARGRESGRLGPNRSYAGDIAAGPNEGRDRVGVGSARVETVVERTF